MHVLEIAGKILTRQPAKTTEAYSSIYKISIFVKRKAIPIFLTILVYHSRGENAFVASQDRVEGLKLRDLNLYVW